MHCASQQTTDACTLHTFFILIGIFFQNYSKLGYSKWGWSKSKLLELLWLNFYGLHVVPAQSIKAPKCDSLQKFWDNLAEANCHHVDKARSATVNQEHFGPVF